MYNRNFVLGIDAGGTSIRAALRTAVTEEDNLVSLECPAAPDGGPEPLETLLSALLKQVGAVQVVSVCAGITKITRGNTRERWKAMLARLFPHAQVVVVPDYQIAFHGAVREGAGIAVVAGTGSVAYGENATGGGLRIGGRGWEFGDEGSGAWLTTEMVRRTLRALDGLEIASPLTEKVAETLQTRDAAMLGERARQQIESHGRGFLVPLLLEQAVLGDTEAKNLYTGAGGWLAALVRAGLTRLGVSASEAVVVATIGGLWHAGDLLLVPFTQVVRRWYPNAQVQPPDGSPLIGALRLASRTPSVKIDS